VPRISGSYDHGHRDGTWTWTDRDNNKEREGNYIKGQRDGVWTEWTENQPTLVGTYVAGKLDGTWIVTDKTGAELGRYDLADGTGTVLTFWPNKKVSSKTAMYKGSQDGPYVELSPRGKVMLDGHFSGDRKHGAWKTFTEGGQLVTESHWRHGRLDKDVTKLDSGSEDLHGTFKDGRATGAYRELRGGKPAVTGQLVDDKRDGTWTEYAADGTVRLISTYKAGVLNGPWHQVTAGVTLDGELVNGRRAGTWTRTDASGATTTIQY
jgi:antitoxin component YwqK of YwqJK toxin-antitoxin module